MIVCHVCGTENPVGSKFCEGCGVELSAAIELNVGSIAAPVVEPMMVEALEAPMAIPSLDTPIAMPALEPLAEIAAPAIDAVAQVPDAVDTAADDAIEAASKLTIPGLSALPEVAMPQMPALEITPPPLPVVAPDDEAALDLEVMPTLPPVVAAVVAPVSSTLDGSFNPKATMESPIKVARLIPRNLGASSNEGHVMHSERMVVGRFDPSAGPVDIDLSGGQGENYISRRHAEVYLENGVWSVRDLGSTNGVYVKRAGQAQYSPRIIEPQALSDGDEVAFGNMKFLFVNSSDAA